MLGRLKKPFQAIITYYTSYIYAGYEKLNNLFDIDIDIT